MKITNDDNIKKWSTVPREELEKFGDGDMSRIQMLNPSILQLLGEVNKKQILDAGCGTGYLSRILAKKNARVTGIEPGESLFAYAVEKENNEKLGIRYIKEDLSKLTEFEENFDIVVANMVFMDIPDYKTAMKNCITALKHDGIFVYSLLHPCFPGFDKEWQTLQHVEIKDYFTEFTLEAQYGYVFYRPLQNYINFTNDQGCLTERIIEPQLSKEFAEENPLLSRSYSVPQFIIIKARKIV